MTNKQKAYILYKRQKRRVEDMKREYKSLVKTTTFAKRKGKRQELKQEERILNEMKEAWKQEVEENKKQKASQDEIKKHKEKLENASSMKEQIRAIKKIQESIEYPESDWFSFNMLPGYTMDPVAPKIYLGRYSNEFIKGRYRFVVEIKLKNNVDNVLEKMQKYFAENRTFWGRVHIVCAVPNFNNRNVWGISGDTDNPNIIGFCQAP